MADLKENVIEWINGQDTIAVTLHQGRYITKVEKLAKKFPKQVKILARNTDGSIFAKLPLKALRLNLSTKSEMSEEQRAEVRARLQQGKAAKEEDWDDEECPYSEKIQRDIENLKNLQTLMEKYDLEVYFYDSY